PETPPISEQVTHWRAGEPEAEPQKPEPQPQEPQKPEPQEPAAQEPEEHPQQHPEPEEPRRPLRWGDRVKPTDVLVHPRTNEDTGKDTDKDADTQPVQVVEDVPDPGHGPEAADPRSRDELEDTAPHPVVTDAPSGRLRSTPLPPEE
ncbi:hypothetical protein, partial [Nonomuraea sp. SBT364]|uniref:hypothetical protein n=1 Tax=Nonomuraea sp. SBT364 TaxID=1580530 RepID=UPI00066DA68F